MELVFLLLLILLMVAALTAGYPVAFALPGASILAVTLAAVCGWIFAGDSSAYFAQDGPTQWLSAGVTNFRSLYWDVERDTLIAIPLFVFMGIMLQRSKIAEDLLVAMAQLFGPVPGGLGISVVFVGALLAATTGIVGATVIAMGLISLPAMLRNNYSKPLATGTICASGTLGQIIPPSIVLIILADQLSNAVEQASAARKVEYTAATGNFSMPSELDITSASAGDMFMGALLPGILLVGIYMAYILISALLRPGSAPPVPYDGNYDRKFALRIFLALVPPLTLIFTVLGSIVSGIATVNQAGAIGAIGAMIMGGYRLKEGKRGAYWPALLALAATALLLLLPQFFEVNVKNIKTGRDMLGIALSAAGALALGGAVLWSAWRAYKVDDTLRGVMIDTAKTTSMVFIILIGAAMLTSAFRGFGGEHLVKEFLTGLPGGFWTQFVVVMVVIFLLGFFLDFIEIAVVVVPIVAPILLSDPSANVTAVWLGVMIGLNIQTSFLTPPFGFALFYLRGVAPARVKTTQIYKGAFAFIALQLAGLAVVGYFPGLVNYLPNRTYLTSDTAPPPVNPRLQYCMEERVFAEYDARRGEILGAAANARELGMQVLPAAHRDALRAGIDGVANVYAHLARVENAERDLQNYIATYAPLQRTVRRLQLEIRGIEDKLKKARNRRLPPEEIAALRAERETLLARIPPGWAQRKAEYDKLAANERNARRAYRKHADESYAAVRGTQNMIMQSAQLRELQTRVPPIFAALDAAGMQTARAQSKTLLDELQHLGGVDEIRAHARKAHYAISRASDRDAARASLREVAFLLDAETAWRAAAEPLLPGLARFDDAIKTTIGLRLQERLTDEQAKDIAACQSVHRDVSLAF